jgi:hypothetical protein
MGRRASSIACQFPPAPVVLFAIGIKYAFDVPVQRPHDANPREHRRSARRRDQDQGFRCSLPFRRRVLSLR